MTTLKLSTAIMGVFVFLSFDAMASAKRSRKKEMLLQTLFLLGQQVPHVKKFKGR